MKTARKIIIFTISLFFLFHNGFAQEVIRPIKRSDYHKTAYQYREQTLTLTDTVKNPKKPTGIVHNGIFISAGFGLDVPFRDLGRSSNPTFGILGKLEYGSSAIFPFIPGVEVDYFSYAGSDTYVTLHLLNGFRTRIFSYGVTLEYTLSKLLNSAYTIPFVTLDVKNNKITREINPAGAFTGFPNSETRISVGGGFGFTLFVFDFYTRFNYMKELSNLGFYAKLKIPIIQF